MTDFTYDIARQRQQELREEAANQRMAQEAMRANKRNRPNNWLRRLTGQDTNRMETGEKN
jgi:hypothetical protein